MLSLSYLSLWRHDDVIMCTVRRRGSYHWTPKWPVILFTIFDEEGSLRWNIPTSVVYTMAISAGSIFDISKYRYTCENSISILSGIAINNYSSAMRKNCLSEWRCFAVWWRHRLQHPNICTLWNISIEHILETTRECVLSKYSTMWSRGLPVAVKANRTWLPKLLLRPQRQEVTYTMWLIDDDDTLTASTVTGTGQTGSPLAEADVEEETDLFLKTVAKTLWYLLCVLLYSQIFVWTGRYNCNFN